MSVNKDLIISKTREAKECVTNILKSVNRILSGIFNRQVQQKNALLL